jgi:hypothetical protein
MSGGAKGHKFGNPKFKQVGTGTARQTYRGMNQDIFEPSCYEDHDKSTHVGRSLANFYKQKLEHESVEDHLHPDERKFKLKIKDNDSLLDKMKFLGAYSNGPLDKKDRIRGRLAKNTKERDMAARLIQKWFRGHRIRKLELWNRKYFHNKFIMQGASLDFSTIIAKGIKSKQTSKRSNSQNRSNITTGRARTRIGGGDHRTENDLLRSRRHPGGGQPYNMFGGISR